MAIALVGAGAATPATCADTLRSQVTGARAVLPAWYDFRLNTTVFKFYQTVAGTCVFSVTLSTTNGASPCHP